MSQAEKSLNEFAEEVQKSNHVTVSSDRYVIRCPHSDKLRICSAETVASENGRTFRCREPIAVKKAGEMVVSFKPTDESCPCRTTCCIK